MNNKGESKLCALCNQCLSHPRVRNSNNSPGAQGKYYLLCKNGHIMCEGCIDKNTKQKGINFDCNLNESSHERYNKPIECLKHNREQFINPLIKGKTSTLNTQYQNSRVELAELKLKYSRQISRSPYESYNNSLMEINPNEININQSQTFGFQGQGQHCLTKTQIQKMKQDIAYTKAQIKEHWKQYWSSLLMVDVLISTVVLVGMILQVIEVLQFRVANNNTSFILIVYFALFGALELPFLVLIYFQACKRFQNVSLQSLTFLIFTTILHPIFVPLSVLMNTFQILEGKSYENIFFIPKKFPIDIQFNYAIFLLTIGVYWIYIYHVGYAYSKTFEEVSFVWSFFEGAGLIYLNIRYNQNREEMSKVGKRREAK